MEKANKIELGNVQETLLYPLWERATETQKKKPLLIDDKAVEIMNSIPYDFTLIEKNSRSLPQRIGRYGTVGRYIYFDDKIKTFINSFPEATIVNIGCGFDTTFSRVDNGNIQWIDLDMPNVIDLRKEYFAESDRNRFIAKSVFDTSWYDSIENKDHVMLLIAGVIYYFDEDQIKRLFKDFQTYLPRAEVVFDFPSRLLVKIINKTMLRKWGMDARWIWGINNIRDIEKWDCGLEVIESLVGSTKEFKRGQPLKDRIEMTIFDILFGTFKLGAGAHVKIHPPIEIG